MVFSDSPVVAFHSLDTPLVLAITDPNVTQNICRI